MAFTQSFEFGNSTLMQLEREAKDANAELDIIQESPPRSSINIVNKSHSRLIKNLTNYQNTSKNSSRRFRKSKSDSTLTIVNNKLEEKAKESNINITNYSEFFRSDFSFSSNQAKSTNWQKPPNDASPLVNESQILAAFNDTFQNNVHDDDAVSVFEAPICSEDVRELLSMETETEMRRPIFSTSTTKNVAVETEIPNLDESCFVCPPRSRKEIRQFAKDLEQSHSAFDLAQDIALNTQSQNKRSFTAQNKPIKAVERHQQPTKEHATETPVERHIDTDDLKRISAWNLPHSIQQVYDKKGVTEMFDWQVECLRNPKVLFEHCNLVYSAPTSAGKTLVSEILLLQTVLERDKKVLVILPFISVVREKMCYLQDLLTHAGYRVEGFYGGYTPPGGFNNIQVAICTIEKANSIVNKLMEQGKLDEIGTIIVDEVHLISDPGRGYILELLIAKILYMSKKYGIQIQIITMSATLANVELLQRWLNAETYITHFRPVQLQEMIKVGTKIYDSEMRFLRDVTQPLPNEEIAFPALDNDSDHVAQLCIETILEGCSVMVFCPSKDWCENLAMQLASAIHSLGKSGSDFGKRLRAQLNREAIDDVKTQLRDIPTGLDKVLEKTVTFGCAFHHAGLTTEERDIIETSFKSCVLKVIIATSTLSSGVNLPARRVLIRSPLFGGKQMNSLTYRQMIGRAGRTGKDTQGQSILICTETNARIGRDLITADLKPITSCLNVNDYAHFKRALLEVIASGVVSTMEDIDTFVKCTLLKTQPHTLSGQKKSAKSDSEESDEDDSDDDHCHVDHDYDHNSCIHFLTRFEFVRMQTDQETGDVKFVPTQLGLACLASSIPPADGLILFAELQNSRRCFVLDSELHAVYLVTPYSVCYQLQDLDWLLFLDLWENLTPAMKKVGDLVGVKESFLVRAMRGQSKLDYKLLQIHKRFYTALALQELVNETPINVVAQKFKCNRGMLQNLQQMSSTFAGIVTNFCSSLQWSSLALIISQFKERLYFGIHSDLIDLMRLPDVTRKRARALFDGGITNLVELANSDCFSLEKVLYNSLSFDSAKQHENEDAYEAQQRNNARNFFITGKTGMTVAEAANLLIQEARKFIQYDIGVGNIKWTQESSPKSNENISEMHMSCEEEHFGRIEPECKSKHPGEGGDTPIVSPAKKQKLHHCQDKKVDKIEDSPVQFIRDAGNIELRPDLQKSPQIQIDDVSSEVATKQVQEKNDLKVSNRTQTKEKELESNVVKPEEAQKSQLNSLDSKVVEVMRIINSANKSSSKIKESLDEEYPSTSAAARKQLLQKQMAERRMEALERKNKKRAILKENLSKNGAKGSPAVINVLNVYHANTENTPNKENIMTAEFKLPTQSPELRKSNTEQRCLKANTMNSENKKTKINKMQSSIPTQMPMPRRSPRYHGSSPKTTPNKTNEMELFMDDDSFLMNTGVKAAINAVECKTIKLSTSSSKNTEPGDEEEIPSSQHNDDHEASTKHPTSSHTLRSFHQQRTQRLATPLRTQSKPFEGIIAKSVETKSDEQTYSSIEFSDLSVENSLMKDPFQLNSSHISLSCTNVNTESSCFKEIKVIDICRNEKLFNMATKELMEAKRMGFSIGLQQEAEKSKRMIGGNLLLNQVGTSEKSTSKSLLFRIDDSNFLVGVAFSMKENIVYFMNMQEDEENDKSHITTETKLAFLVKLLSSNEDLTLLIHDAKEQLKLARRAIPKLTKFNVKIEDPKVANWLLQPDKTLSFHNMCQQFAPECLGLVNLCGGSRHCYTSYGLDSNNTIPAKLRCCIEACVTGHILKGQIENLERIGAGQLHKFFSDIEMPIQMSLCEMELIGFPVQEKNLQKLFQQMVATMNKLEKKIYEMNGSRFNLGSSAAVAKVVGLHRKTNGRISTSRQILEKIDSPISQLIVVYRKLSVTLSKNIQPLLKCVQQNRIHGQSITHTSTGRISMIDPNLQNVAKDFEVDFGKEKLTISCRNAFAPANKNRCLIASDFCQLEMRILAHVSQDAALLEVMKSECDLFVAIAARWNHIEENAVSEQMRNGTKQICYGIIYGMGMRSLAEALKCTEQEAKMVSQQFHTAYPGIRAYTEKVVRFARKNGYIETVTGRRRYLDNINSGEPLMKNQAERQAINSTIQGSAADIAKSAILKMERNLKKYRIKLGLDEDAVHLVLHLHDELIYEVPTDKANKIAKVLSLSMESCAQLKVPLKVKLKVGKSWGELKDIR